MSDDLTAPLAVRRHPVRTTGRPTGACLVCGGERVDAFLDLGRTALANKFLTREELDRPEVTHPLRLAFCRGCAHVQLAERVPPSAMFDDYLYISSASDTLRRHFEELSGHLVDRFGLGAEDLVVDIGCNDASLLGAFRRRGVRTLGVDPALNLAELAAGNGVERYTGYFGAETAREIADRWGRARLVTATNTFPHIPDLPDFMRGIEAVLEPEGTFVVEAHYLLDLLDQLAFDTVYHEHVSYWALGPMMRLFADHGFEVVDAQRLPLHHGQLRVYARRAGVAEPTPSVKAILREERRREIDRLETWKAFARRVGDLRREVLATLNGLKEGGHRLAAYGAPAKGSTLLEYFGIGADLIDFIADRSPLKQGRYTPGSHIPIVAPERLLIDRPDYVLLLAWNFEEEILAQQADFRAGGGRFVVPVPQVRIV